MAAVRLWGQSQAGLYLQRAERAWVQGVGDRNPTPPVLSSPASVLAPWRANHGNAAPETEIWEDGASEPREGASYHKGLGHGCVCVCARVCAVTCTKETQISRERKRRKEREPEKERGREKKTERDRERERERWGAVERKRERERQRQRFPLPYAARFCGIKGTSNNASLLGRELMAILYILHFSFCQS